MLGLQNGYHFWRFELHNGHMQSTHDITFWWLRATIIVMEKQQLPPPPFFVFDFLVAVKIITPLSVTMEGSPSRLLPCFKIFHSAVIYKKVHRSSLKVKDTLSYLKKIQRFSTEFQQRQHKSFTERRSGGASPIPADRQRYRRT